MNKIKEILKGLGIFSFVAFAFTIITLYLLTPLIVIGAVIYVIIKLI